MPRPLPTGFPNGIVWTEEEWRQLAQAWARHEKAHPDCSLPDRWKLLVPEVFAADRQRPLPKANLQTRAKRLFELLPDARKEAAAAPLAPSLSPVENKPLAPSRPALQIVPSAPAASRAPSNASVDEESSKRRRIFWTYDERQAFVRAYALLEQQHPHMPASTRVVKAQDMAIASGGITEDRRRTANPTVLLNSPELKPMLELAREEVSSRTSVAVTELSTSQPHPAPSKPSELGPPSRQGLLPSASGEPVAPVSLEGSPTALLAQAFEALLKNALASPLVQQALSDQLAPLMRQAVLDVLNGPPLDVQAAEAAPGASPDAPVQPVPESLPRKKLLIVGLLGSQQQEILSGFADKFDLRFLTQDDSSTRLEQHARSCDTTIGMVGFLSHAVEKHLKRASSDYRRCNGTLGELRRLLQGVDA